MICIDCRTRLRRRHSACELRNRHKSGKDCDCQHKLKPVRAPKVQKK